MTAPLLIQTISLICQALQNVNVLHSRAEFVVSDWTLLMGDNVGNQVTEVTAGLDSGDDHKTTHSHPGSRESAVSWMDQSGQAWMFGGVGFDKSLSGGVHVLDELWKFNLVQQEWSLISVKGQNKRTLPSPGGRHSAAACGVHNLVFVTFGGENGFGKVSNELWMFDIQNLNWLQLESASGPVARKQMAYWCMHDAIIIFGGIAEDNVILDDMWRFSLLNFKWTEIHLSKTPDTPPGRSGSLPHGHSGSLPHGGSGSLPHGRSGPLCWKSSDNQLYMFSGKTIEKEEHGHKTYFLPDMWVFNTTDKFWYLITNGAKSNDDIPQPRIDGICWNDKGSLWLYGGQTCDSQSKICSILSDLWIFSLDTQQWTRANTASISYTSSCHGRNIKNSPGRRYGSTAWSHQGIKLLFGGLGIDQRNRTSYLDDLWILNEKTKRYILTSSKADNQTSPSLVFLMVLASIAGIFISFGAIFFLKKMLAYSNARESSGDFRVRYSPLSQDATLEM